MLPGFVKYHLAALCGAQRSLFESQDPEEIRSSRAFPVVWPHQSSITGILWCTKELPNISYCNIVRVQKYDLQKHQDLTWITD